MARLRIPGITLAAEVAISAALDAVLRRLDSLERKPTAPALVTGNFTAREGQYVRVQAPPSGLRILLPKPTSTNRGAEITFSLETTGPVTFLCVDGLVNGEGFVLSTLLGTFKAICNGETGWSVGFGVTSSGNTPGPAGPPGVQGLPGDPGEPGEPGPPGDSSHPLRPIPDQRVLGNDSGAVAYPSPITVHQELDWVGEGAQAWIFDGVDDEIQMGDVLNMTRTTPRSVFVWYSTTASGAVGVGKQSGASTAGWRFAVPSSSATQDLILSNSGGSQQLQVGASPRPPTDGSEHHFGWTYNGNSNASGVTLYLDGAATGKSTGTNNLTSGVTTNTEPLQIGQRGTSAPFAGTLRHVSIWNRELTASEVAQVYGAGSPPDLSLLSFFGDCIGWWKIDSSDTTAAGGIADYSSSNNDGTALNGLSPTDVVGALLTRGITQWQVITPGLTGAFLMSSGTGAIPVWAHPANVTSSVTGTQNALAFPATFKNRDTLDLTLTGNTTLNGIDATGIPAGFEFILRVGTSGGFTLTANNESGSATSTNRLNTPDNLAVLLGEDCGVVVRRALTRWLFVDRGWPNASTSIVYNGRAIERAAMTGAVTAAQNSNTTAFGAAAAKSALVNATNASAVPAFLAAGAGRRYLRSNAAFTALEWGALSSDELPPGPPGPPGEDGLAGDMGPPGPTGATGPTGQQGPPGIDGIDGVDGIEGAVGPTGPTGATGPQGPPGAPGEQGETGDEGPRGATGIIADVAANTVVANPTTSTAQPVGLSVGTNTVVGRVAGNVVAAALVNAQVDANAAIALSKLATQTEATICGRARGAGTGVPIALSGTQVGAVLRVGGQFDELGAPGTYNDYVVTEGIKLLRINPTGTGDFIITGIAYGSSNSDGWIRLFKQAGGGTDRVVLKHDDAGSAAGNRFQLPNAVDLVLESANDSVDLQFIGGRWQPIARVILPSALAPVRYGIAVAFVIYVSFAAGAGGAADDVTVFAATAPFAFRIIDVNVLISTAVGASTVQLRDTTGGGGSTLSSSLSSAATGTVRNNDTATRTVASAGSIYLRRSDSGVAGEVIISAVRT